jgi:LytS/YehU family sensor histidine kinase
MKSAGTFWDEVLKINVLNLAIYMTAYYFLRWVQLPYLFYKKKWVYFVLSFLATSLLFYFIWRLAGVYWIDAVYYPKKKLPFFRLFDFFTQTVQFYSPTIALLAGEFYQEKQAEKLRIEQLEKEKLATELKFLKAQINPHFLFNTLNNLYSFVINQSPKAPEIILHLSGMLDYILYRSQEKQVALGEEIENIENFIALEKIRYGERLQVDFCFEGNRHSLISPLILLSLVENAFKHGASGDIDEPKIKVKIFEKESVIDCEVWNTKSPYEGELNDAYKEGIGLTNIQRQLNLIYANKHSLEIEDSPTTFRIALKLENE